jgi:hypothetical protein
MASPADTDLLNELDWVSARAHRALAGINKRLNETVSPPPASSIAEFLTSEREIRDRLEEAREAAERLRARSTSEHEEQRSRDALVVRKATLAIELQVTRLGALLDALL